MNEIVHSSLKINLIGTELMKRIVHTDQLTNDHHTEADNWKEQFKSLQLEMEVVEEEKCTLEQQSKVIAAELAIEKALSNQAGKDKNILESSFSEKLSRASKEIRSLKDLLNQKEAYAGELVQLLTQTQEDLRESSNKVQFLERSLAPLQASYDVVVVERDELRADVEQWEKDYEALEDKTVVDVSWAYLNARLDTLTEVGQENFDLQAEIAKTKETIERSRQSQSISSPEVEVPVGDEIVPDEVDAQPLPSQAAPSVDEDNPPSV